MNEKEAQRVALAGVILVVALIVHVIHEVFVISNGFARFAFGNISIVEAFAILSYLGVALFLRLGSLPKSGRPIGEKWIIRLGILALIVLSFFSIR